MGVYFEVDPGNKLRDAIREAANEVGDLTVPLTLITKQWYQSNKAIYMLQGPGQYADLSDGHVGKDGVRRGSYKAAKDKRWGFIYPILKASGRLMESILNPTNSEAINQILSKKTLVLGSSVPYAKYLQEGTKHMPSRPYVLIGAEQTGGPEVFNERQQIYVNILEDWVQKVLAKRLKE